MHDMHLREAMSADAIFDLVQFLLCSFPHHAEGGERKKREYRCHFFAILTFSEVGFFSSKRMTDAAEDVGGERCTISLHQQPTTHKDSKIPSKSYNQKLGLPIYPCSLVSFVLSLARTDKKTIFWTFWAADSSPTIGLRVRNPK